MRPKPVTKPSPAGRCSCMPKSTQQWRTNLSSSSKVASSSSRWMRSRAVSLPALCSRSRRSAPPPPSASASKRRSSSVRSSRFAVSEGLGVGIRLRLVSDTGFSCRRGFRKCFGGFQGRRLFRAKDADSKMRGQPGGTKEENDAKKQLGGHGGGAVQGRFERGHCYRRPNQDEHGGKSHRHNQYGRNNRSKDLFHRTGLRPKY